jgi:25S rRNA (adenine2142-N1)-methyltransferase
MVVLKNTNWLAYALQVLMLSVLFLSTIRSAEKNYDVQIQGQSEKRGGDSSKILLIWIRDTQKTTAAPVAGDVASVPIPKLRLLEVGSLSTRNAISKSPLFTVTRIDLNAREPSIESQDFMERPLPASEDEKFDIISLSLVLNYVPEPAGRGEMLRRTATFLRASTSMDPANPLSKLFPSVFLVLPAPCVGNSRHLNEKRLAEIMRCIGYVLVRRKLSTKLIYGLWKLEDSGIPKPSGALAKKVEVNPGVSRNNFAILLK